MCTAVRALLWFDVPSKTTSAPRVTRLFERRATLRRSIGLLGSFRFEQTAPDKFYGGLAHDTVDLVGDLYTGLTGNSLAGTTVVDVGGGPGYFADAFAEVEARYVPIEPDPSEMHAAGLQVGGAIRGSGLALPLRTGSVDVCLSSNVAEHVSQPWVMADEMLRVTRPGGLMVLSYTLCGGRSVDTRPVRGTHSVANTQRVAMPGSTGRNRRTDTVCRCSSGVHRRPPLGSVDARRRAARRVPPLPPAVGVVARSGARGARVPGEQPGARAAAPLIA